MRPVVCTACNYSIISKMKDKHKDIVAIFPGSFDPFTRGHVDISQRALNLFSKVIVAILENPVKEALFTVEERKTLIKEALSDFEGELEIDSFSGLLVDYAKTTKADVIVRGFKSC